LERRRQYIISAEKEPGNRTPKANGGYYFFKYILLLSILGNNAVSSNDVDPDINQDTGLIPYPSPKRISGITA
jgi:hypothetical protein